MLNSCKDCVSRRGRRELYLEQPRGQPFRMSALSITEAVLNHVRALYDYCYCGFDGGISVHVNVLIITRINVGGRSLG